MRRRRKPPIFAFFASFEAEKMRKKAENMRKKVENLRPNQAFSMGYAESRRKKQLRAKVRLALSPASALPS